MAQGCTSRVIHRGYLSAVVRSSSASLSYSSTMILSDGSIRKLISDGQLIIDPIEDEQIQPASVDVRLGNQFLVFRNHTSEVIDPYDK